MARVTMKEGNPVVTTSHPLVNPMAAAKRNVRKMDGQTPMLYSVISRPAKRPDEPIMTPLDRSNSPPIISSATATAMIPYVEATSVHRAVPSREKNVPVWSATEKKM